MIFVVCPTSWFIKFKDCEHAGECRKMLYSIVVNCLVPEVSQTVKLETASEKVSNEHVFVVQLVRTQRQSWDTFAQALWGALEPSRLRPAVDGSLDPGVKSNDLMTTCLNKKHLFHDNLDGERWSRLISDQRWTARSTLCRKHLSCMTFL